MYIASALITNQEVEPYCFRALISTERNSAEDGTTVVYNYEMPLAQEIMKTVAQRGVPARFVCNGIAYKIITYAANAEEENYNPYRKNGIKHKEHLPKHTDIYVFSERCRCTSCYQQWGFDSIENVCGVVRTAKTPSQFVRIDIQKCRRCHKYFIDKQSLAQYEKRYGSLDIKRHYISGNEYKLYSHDECRYNPDTVLSRNGYSTSLDEPVRRKILIGLLDDGTSKAEIKDVLTRFIAQRSDRCPYAAQIWKKDLVFINEYNLDRQRMVRFG